MSINELSVAQVAEGLGVTPETVRRYIREKRFPARKAATKGLKTEWLVRESDLKVFAEGRGLALDLAAARAGR